MNGLTNADSDNYAENPENSNRRRVNSILYGLASVAGFLMIGLVLLVLVQSMQDQFRRLYYSPKLPKEDAILGISLSDWLVIILIQQYLALLVSLSIGILVYWVSVIRSKRHDWTAWLFSLTLAMLTVIPLGNPRFSITDFEEIIHQLQAIFLALASIMVINLLLIFPNGRFTPRWMKWVALVYYFDLAAILLLSGLNNWLGGGLNSTVETFGFLVFIFTFVCCGLLSFAGQIYRYLRVSNPLEKQQSRWVLVSLASIPVYIAFLIFDALTQFQSVQPALYAFIDGFLKLVMATVIPLSTAFAILRYRLWDIDFILRRTLSYSLLTALLGLLYYSAVTLLQNIFSGLSGQASPAVLVISTLAIAALFTPLRNRIQEFIDRRFYRRKYDAEKALAQFAAVARSETDLKKLTRALLEVTEETMQPENSSLWFLKK